MIATYVVGVLGIAGVLLPDWGYFNRDFSRWTSPITAEERAAQIAQRSGSKRLASDWILQRIYFFLQYALFGWWENMGKKEKKLGVSDSVLGCHRFQQMLKSSA
jgi:hypothetical protein